MRQISFSLTTPQFLSGSKDVTRRVGWKFLKPGDRLMAIEKGQGLKKGEHVKKLGQIEIVEVSFEPLMELIAYPRDYPNDEMRREGFPGMNPVQFVNMFTRNCAVSVLEPVTRIVFKRVEKVP